MASNVRDIIEGKLARSLAFVFAQLEQLDVKRSGQYMRPRPRPLTRAERALIRQQLRRDLKASWELCKKKDDDK